MIKPKTSSWLWRAPLKFAKWIISRRLIFICTNTQLIVVNQAGQAGSGACCARHHSSEETLQPPTPTPPPPRAHARIRRGHQRASIVQIAFGFAAPRLYDSLWGERGRKAGPQFALGNSVGRGREGTHKTETLTFP